MIELMIALHEGVQPFKQMFYVCCFISAVLILLTTTKAKQGAER
tara:strand:- start:1941 stop:2072 length:132 start_codon:yes stop_codon:yes gene_type:complete